MDIKNNKLYTGFSQTMALTRCGASKMLHCEKAWSVDGELVSSTSKYAFVAAYNIHELMNINFGSQIEIPITGNSKNDIAFAVSKIVKEVMKKNCFPFRVWNCDRYLSQSDDTVIMTDMDGILRTFHKNQNGTLSPVDSGNTYEVEEFTGYFDSCGVPIFRNDSVISLKEKLIYTIVKILDWQLRVSLNDCIDKSLYNEKNRIVVIGSSRSDLSVLSKIINLIQ